MISEARKQSMAWMETDYSKHTHFRWKIKWWLEHLGSLGIMDLTAQKSRSFSKISSVDRKQIVPKQNNLLTYWEDLVPTFSSFFPQNCSKHSKMLFPGQTDLQVNSSFQLAFRLATYLASPYVYLRWLWSSSKSYSSQRKFFTVWPPNASQHKLIASDLYMHETYDFSNLRADLRIRLVTLRKSVRKFWLCKLALTCVDLRIRLSSCASFGFANLR